MKILVGIQVKVRGHTSLGLGLDSLLTSIEIHLFIFWEYKLFFISENVC